MGVRLVCAAMACLLEVGCATSAQLQAQDIKQSFQLASIEQHNCRDQIYKNPRLASIAEHIPEDLRSATLLQLSDISFPSTDEVSELDDFYTHRTRCLIRWADELSAKIPALIPVFAYYATKQSEVFVALRQGKLSWGDATTQLKLSGAEASNRFSFIMGRVANQLQAQHLAELAERRATLEAIDNAVGQAADAYQTQQLINSLRRH